ncbi:hypothetical protein H0H92_006612 [Tricholoma furcatifolium]|nr:hypothetical protein H0H92_006612 [Tricholoma furcatifolium]
MQMQQPTLRGVRIRSAQDVHRIFYGVQMERLKMLERRLDIEEREALESGCVYVWEQRASRSVDVTGEGMDRFTEGKSWGPSRVRDDFLFYTQKANSQTHPWDLLIKQTYSAWVDMPEGRRKWHLNNTIDRLHTIDDILSLRDIRPPPGLYQCAKAKTKLKNKHSTEDPGSSQSSTPPQDPSSSSRPASVNMAQPYAKRSEPLPRTVADPHPIALPPSFQGNPFPVGPVSTGSVPLGNPPVLGGPVRSRPTRNRHTPPFSLPPVDSFVFGHLPDKPSPTGSIVEPLLWDPSYKLSPCNNKEDDDNGGPLALASLHRLSQRVYIRDPTDDKVIRSLPP